MTSPSWKPEYDSYLVLDVEATCELTRRYGVDGKGVAFHSGKVTNYDYPNEIIEFPVLLLQWNQTQQNIELLDTFQTYVRPQWRPQLSQFCKDLTGITQSQVSQAPLWPDVVLSLYDFLKKHNLLKLKSQGENRLSRMHDRKLRAGVAWVTHGPSDLRDFVIKQCWISGQETGTPPMFLRGPLIDIRRSVAALFDWEVELLERAAKEANKAKAAAQNIEFGGKDGFQVVTPSPPQHTGPLQATTAATSGGLTKQDLSLKGLLELMGLGAFQGREHCGLDDTKNVARLLVEMGRRVRAMADGKQVFFHHNAKAKKEERVVPKTPFEAKGTAERARKMERECLVPNTRTDRVEKRWRFMGKKPGSVTWAFPPEDVYHS